MTLRAALFFDLDGTLVDSDPQHLAAFQRVFTPHGISLDRDAYDREVHGASNETIGKTFLSHLPVERRSAILAEKEAIYRAELGEIEPIAGAMALLDFADERRLRRAVVTNAPRANAEAVLSALGLAARLPIVVVGSELERSKPDPLPYIEALKRTGALASRSVAFEDSPSGVRSAAAAGLAVIGLTTTLARPALMAAGATIVVNDFADPLVFELIGARVGVAREAEASA